MQILYLIKKEPGKTLRQLIEAQQKTHEVEIIELKDSPDYDAIMDRIIAADRVISW